MLQTLHDKSSGIFVKIVLGVLVIVFGGFFGIQSYMTERTETYVAKVDGTEISQQEFRSRFDEYRSQMQRMMGGKVDPLMFENAERKREILERLVDEQLLLAANEQLGIAVPVERLRDEIAKIPAFQTNGKFDREQYKTLLNAQRMTPLGFEQRMRRDIEIQELTSQLASSSFVTEQQLDAYLRLRDQTRDFRYVMLDKIKSDAGKVENSEIEAYYKEHSSDFINPEKVSVEYLELDANKLELDSKPDEGLLKARYEEQKARFVSNEQRLASHILVKVEKNADAAAQKATLDKANEIATMAKSTKDFAKLAKDKSDDLGSKGQGGDLGWLEKGITEGAFETALFAMKKGDISEPVLSPEGYHIVQLRDVRPEKTKTYDEVKAEIAKEYLDSERERLYSDLSGRLTDLIYQDPSSLEPAAKALGLAIQKTDLFSRQGGVGIAANPAVTKAAFSEAVLLERNTSDPVELGSNHVVVLRIAEHQASTPKPLDEVRQQIQARISTEHIALQAKQQAEQLAERLAKGETLVSLAEELKLKVSDAKNTLRTAANLDTQLVKAVFAMPRGEAGKTGSRMITLGNDAYALVELDAITDGDPTKVDATAREAARSQLVQGLGNESSHGYIESLRKSAKIKIVEERM